MPWETRLFSARRPGMPTRKRSSSTEALNQVQLGSASTLRQSRASLCFSVIGALALQASRAMACW